MVLGGQISTEIGPVSALQSGSWNVWDFYCSTGW